MQCSENCQSEFALIYTMSKNDIWFLTMIWANVLGLANFFHCMSFRLAFLVPLPHVEKFEN